MVHCNIGCGQTSTPGWLNYDNSLSLRLSTHPLIVRILDKIGFLDERQKEYIKFAQNNDIMYADATKKIPLPDKSVEVLYTSHMVEHLDREEIEAFLKEARRVLISGGVIRIAFPDLRLRIAHYNEGGDADVFMEGTGLARTNPRGLRERLKFLLLGDRHHKYMYDGSSMVRLLSSIGFKRACVVEAGKTMISEPGELNLYEREDESTYVEAYKI